MARIVLSLSLVVLWFLLNSDTNSFAVFSYCLSAPKCISAKCYRKYGKKYERIKLYQSYTPKATEVGTAHNNCDDGGTITGNTYSTTDDSDYINSYEIDRASALRKAGGALLLSLGTAATPQLGYNGGAVVAISDVEYSSALAAEVDLKSTIIPQDIVIHPSTALSGKKTPHSITVPRVGYSFYKTDPSTVDQCLNLALEAGVRHFDVATAYQSNINIGTRLPMLLKKHALQRKDICIAHKLSNTEQSTNSGDVRRAVRKAINDLKISYIDVCYIHSPLTSKEQRIATYRAICDLQAQGSVIRAIGVCHYGVSALNELETSGLPPPSIIQLELSPFNQHKDVVQWAKDHGSTLSCAAWSKLSSVDGPQEGWDVLAKIAKEKGVTKVKDSKSGNPKDSKWLSFV
jgi:diketogulonate reductase-like aldo/keto reductase